MRKLYQLIFIFSVGFLTSCSDDPNEDDIVSGLDAELNQAIENASNGIGKEYYTLPESGDYDNIPQDPNNPITYKKVVLGKMLFHETGLGLNPEKAVGLETYSCASCHFAAGGFQACRRQGLGEGGIGHGVIEGMRMPHPDYAEADIDVQPTRTPSAMNTAYQKNMLWNGQFGATGTNIGTEDRWTAGTPIETNFAGFEGLETQAIAGLGVHRLVIDEADLVINSIYKNLFDEAYPDFSTDERYTKQNGGLAIAAYERTLLSNRAPFQEWLKGSRTAMTNQEKRGALLFFDKANCVKCHNGPSLANMEYRAIGMGDLLGQDIVKSNPDDNAHKGRASFTGNDNDMYKFKVPQLYNLKDSPFFGHGGTFRSVEDVIRYKNEAIAENANVSADHLDAEFIPLGLSDQEIEDLTAFIESALYDAELKRYEPNNLPSGNCFPSNDTESRVDSGCE